MLLCCVCDSEVDLVKKGRVWLCPYCCQHGDYRGTPADTWQKGCTNRLPYWKDDERMIWFSADWHLGHEGILTHHLTRGADFGSVEAMDTAIIDGVNAVVKPDDVLYFLGDFSWRPRSYGHYRSRFQVRKFHAVRGNHDRPRLATFCSTFDDMLYRKFTVKGLKHRVKIHMCHYPLLSWDAMHHGGIHLYGHCHGMNEAGFDGIYPSRRSMDVGIDNIYRLVGEWRPISLDEVLKLFGGDVTDDRLPGPFEELE